MDEFWPNLERMGTDKEKFAEMAGNFYERFGWDRKTGIPTRATLEALDLKDVADELEKVGKLPKSEAVVAG
jgi:hypothetical protein